MYSTGRNRRCRGVAETGLPVIRRVAARGSAVVALLLLNGCGRILCASPECSPCQPPLFIPVCSPVSKGYERERRRFGPPQSHIARVGPTDDIARIPLPVDDAGDPIARRFSSRGTQMRWSCSPEYNHAYSDCETVLVAGRSTPKAVGIVGVSAGPFGGARGIQGLLPVVRELGLVNIFWDVNVWSARTQFDEAGRLKDPDAWVRRVDKFLKELIWMAKVLRHGREQVALE